MTVTFISYADGNIHKKNQLKQQTSLLGFGVFDKIKLLKKEDIDLSFLTKHKTTLSHPKGAGLWLWKPYLICKELQSMSEGSVLFYCDSDWVFNKSPKRFIDMTFDNQIVLFHERGDIASNWTAANTFKAMDADSKKFKNTTMLLAGYSVWKSGCASEAFAKEWLKWCCIPEAMGCGNESRHCYDQSVLTILAKQNGIVPELSPRMDRTIVQQ